MTAYTNVAAGDPILAATVNDLIYASLNRPTVLLALPANQSVTSGAAAAPILFGAGSEIFDTHGWHSTSVNTDRVTPNKAGIYLATVQCLWAANAQDRRCYTAKNGTILGPIGRSSATDAGSNLLRASREIEVNGTTDYISAYVFQADTGALARNVTGAGDSTFSSFFSVVYLRGPS